MSELKVKNSAFKRIEDDRDYKWSNVGSAIEPFDWEKGYDVEEELGFKIPVKNQGQSKSCGGQAFAYYAQVLEYFMTGTFEEISKVLIFTSCFTRRWFKG